MIRQLSILTLITVLVGGAQPGHTQPRSSPPASQADLDEASQLNKRVEKLYSEGKFGEAVPAAEQALALREKALEPMHPDVAQSLNSLAELYWAHVLARSATGVQLHAAARQGAYASST